MRALRLLVKIWLVPGTFPFLCVGASAGVLMLYGPAWAVSAGRAWLTALVVMYALLSLPAVADRLLRSLATPPDAEEAMRATTLIVLGNGSVHYTDGTHGVDYLTRRSVFCAFEGSKQYLRHRPDVVVVSGGGPPGRRTEAALMRELLVEFGVPAHVIAVEDRSSDTASRVDNVLALPEMRGREDRPMIVTTPAHAARVRALCAARGRPVVVVCAGALRYDEGTAGWRRWMPSTTALAGSASAAYEYLARAEAVVRRTRRSTRH